MLLAINTTLRSLMINVTVVGDNALSSYIIPLADAHYGSRIALCDQRLQYISGFSGSAGFGVVGLDSALLWTDGRYFTQANTELDENWTLMKEGLPDTPTLGEFLNRNLTRGSFIGIDPSLYSKTAWDNLQTTLKLEGHTLVPVENNLVDMIWSNRPSCPVAPIFLLDLNFTGKNTADKLIDIRAQMKLENAVAIVVSELDEIAWLLNMRGADLSSSSVFISYLFIQEYKFQLFINSDKITDSSIRFAIANDGGEIHPYKDVAKSLTTFANATTGKIWFSSSCNYALVQRVTETRQIVKLTPIALMKAVKNSVEVAGMKNSLIKDAAAVVKFLHWVTSEIANEKNVTELSAAAQLLEYRKQNEHFLTTSFSSISASGSNGAIIHYRPTPETNRKLTMNDMYLIDSGAIYRDGTTDITRDYFAPKELIISQYC